jgi:signal transduction histidine kinase
MLSQSLSDRQSSTSTPARTLGRVAQAGVLAVVTIAVTAVVYVATAQVLPQALAVMAAGTVVVLALGGATFWSVHRDAVRRRSAEDWHRRLRRELIEQSAFLDGLVGGLGTMSSTLDPALVLERATEQAHQLLAPDATVLLVPAADGNGLRPAAARGLGLGPIADVVVETNSSARFAPVADRGGDDALSKRLRPTARLTVPIVAVDELRGLLVLMRLRGTEPFSPAELTQASVLADFAATAATNAHLFARVESLLAQARMRESERAELSRRVVSAEQDERRKLSLFLHDGPLQTMSGIAMMLDAVAEDTASGEIESALSVLETARERQRGVVRSMRELSFALEPWVLRDRGFVAAVGASSPSWSAATTWRSHRRRGRGRLPPKDRSVDAPCARGRPERREARLAEPGVGLGGRRPRGGIRRPGARRRHGLRGGPRRRPAPPRPGVDARARADPGRQAPGRVGARRGNDGRAPHRG